MITSIHLNEQYKKLSESQNRIRRLKATSAPAFLIYQEEHFLRETLESILLMEARGLSDADIDFCLLPCNQ